MNRRMTIILAIALPVIAVVGYIDTHFFFLADSWDRWEYKRWENDYNGGFREGQELASMDLRAGLTNYCGYGLLPTPATNNGLPMITTGCIVHRRDEGFADGYNHAVARVRSQTSR